MLTASEKIARDPKVRKLLGPLLADFDDEVLALVIQTIFEEMESAVERIVYEFPDPQNRILIVAKPEKTQ